jgi:hypothetical protein
MGPVVDKEPVLAQVLGPEPGSARESEQGSALAQEPELADRDADRGLDKGVGRGLADKDEGLDLGLDKGVGLDLGLDKDAAPDDDHRRRRDQVPCHGSSLS